MCEDLILYPKVQSVGRTGQKTTQCGTILYCLASIKPEGSEVFANHFVLCRFSSLRHIGVLYAFPSSPSFLFSDCFLSRLYWLQEQSRTQESAVVIQQECGWKWREWSRREWRNETLPSLVSQPTQSWRALVAEMVSDIPMFPRDTTADRSLGFLPLTSTEANYERKRE